MTKNVLLVECLTRRSNLTGILIHLAANVYISIQWRKINVCCSAFLCNKVSSFLCKGIVADYKSATTTIIAWFLEAKRQLYLNVLFTTSSCNYRRKTYETYPYKKRHYLFSIRWQILRVFFWVMIYKFMTKYVFCRLFLADKSLFWRTENQFLSELLGSSGSLLNFLQTILHLKTTCKYSLLQR